MGLVVSNTVTYATLADVRAFGVPNSVTDDQINDALDLSVELINDYTGTAFGSTVPMDVVVNDIRKPLVPLPTPFADVTAVEVNGVVISSTQWAQESWGLRLYPSTYYDSDGFPRWDLSNGEPGLYGDGLYGGQVIVTATYGWPDVPAKVKRAAILLATRYATQTPSDLVPDSRIKMLSVEGYRVEWDASAPLLDTTGDEAADGLLARYRSVDNLVA